MRASCTTATPPSAQALAKQLRWSGRGARYVFLRRKLTDDEAAALRALDEPHVRVVAVPQRSYPRRHRPRRTSIGYTDIDNKGQTGVELAMDDAARRPAGPAAGREVAAAAATSAC